MKTLFLVLAVVVGLLLAHNFIQTGEIGFGGGPMSEVERELKRLDDRLTDAVRAYRVAGRGSAVGGMEGTSGAETAVSYVRFVARELPRLKDRASTASEKERVAELEQRLKDVKQSMGIR